MDSTRQYYTGREIMIVTQILQVLTIGTHNGYQVLSIVKDAVRPENEVLPFAMACKQRWFMEDQPPPNMTTLEDYSLYAEMSTPETSLRPF